MLGREGGLIRDPYEMRVGGEREKGVSDFVGFL